MSRRQTRTAPHKITPQQVSRGEKVVDKFQSVLRVGKYAPPPGARNQVQGGSGMLQWITPAGPIALGAKVAQGASKAAKVAQGAFKATQAAPRIVKGARGVSKLSRGSQRVAASVAGGLGPEILTGIPTWLRGREVLRGIRMSKRALQGAKTSKGTSVASLVGRRIGSKWKSMLSTQAKRSAAGYTFNTMLGRDTNNPERDDENKQSTIGDESAKLAAQRIKQASFKANRKRIEAEMHKKGLKPTPRRFPKKEEEK